MAFPVINGSNGGNIVANATSSTINLPASIAAGDRLFALVVMDQNTGSAFTGWPSGWIEVFAVDSATACRAECRYKEATGSEGTSFSLGHALNMSCHVTWKYQAGTFDTATAPAAATATGSDAAPDPPSLDPAAWGTAETSWLAICAYDDGSRSLTSTNASYTTVRNERSSNGQGVGSAVAYRDNAVGTENPGAFAISALQSWIGATIATRPFTGGAAAVIAGTSALTLDGSAELDTTPQHVENFLDFTYKAGQSITVLGTVGDVANDLRAATVQLQSNHRDVEMIVQFWNLGATLGAITTVPILVDDVSGDYPVTFPEPIALDQLVLSCRLQTA